MSLKLSQARKKRVPFKASLGAAEEGGEEQFINGHFNPRSYSPKRLRELRDMDNEDTTAWAQILAAGETRLLVSWDLEFGEEDAEDGLCSEEEVGKPVPITVDRLSTLPLEILVAVSNGITETARPNSKPSPVVSEPGSLTEDEPGPVLTNTDLLKPQDSSE